MSLVTDKEILDYINLNDKCITASMRALVSRVRLKAENLVKDYVGYRIEQANYSELLPAKTISGRADVDTVGGGFDLIGGTVVARSTFPSTRREIVLGQLPVRDIVAVYDAPAAYNTAGGDWPAGSALADNAYYLDRDMVDGPCWSGIVYRNVGSWGIVPRSIRVDYVAGLTALELSTDYTEFGHAVVVTCAKMLAEIAARSNMVRSGMGPVQSVSVEDFGATYAGQNLAFLGGFLGAGVGSAALATESMQVLWHRRHPASLM
jgi:hypothetical protein